MTNRQAQNLLAYLGYYVGDIDGKFGTLSKTACKSFQADFGGISVDGIVGSETEKALKHAVSFGMPLKENEDNFFWDEIKYWNREEFRCHCGGKYCDGFPAEPDKKLVKLVDLVREHFGTPGIPSSGLRCKTWNAISGGVKNSRHLIGKALDFKIEGHSADEILLFLNKQSDTRYAYNIDGTYVHVDVE